MAIVRAVFQRFKTFAAAFGLFRQEAAVSSISFLLPFRVLLFYDVQYRYSFVFVLLHLAYLLISLTNK